MTDEWTEILRCPKCRKTGIATLCQEKDAEAPIVLSISRGFKIVSDQYGPKFYCDTCKALLLP